MQRGCNDFANADKKDQDKFMFFFNKNIAFIFKVYLPDNSLFFDLSFDKNSCSATK